MTDVSPPTDSASTLTTPHASLDGVDGTPLSAYLPNQNKDTFVPDHSHSWWGIRWGIDSVVCSSCGLGGDLGDGHPRQSVVDKDAWVETERRY